MTTAGIDLNFALGAAAGLLIGFALAVVLAFALAGAWRRGGGTTASPRDEIRPAPVLPARQPGAVPVGPSVNAGAEPTPATESGTAARAPAKAASALRDHAMMTAAEQAAALLAFLQGPGGVAGREITSVEIEGAFSDLCIEQGWAPRAWVCVGAELRKLTGGKKIYGYRDGQRVRVWRIPPAPADAASGGVGLRRHAA
jgi:hypothetical protein